MKTMNKNGKKKNKLAVLAAPFIVLLISMAILLIAAIKPYHKLSVYLNLAFMDEFKNDPNDGSNGLNIVDGDIILDYSGETSSEGSVVRPSFGEQFAVIRSSGMELSVPVYWGSDRELFERGACQATYSKLPGEAGKTVISAHEDTFFSELSELSVGDNVTVNTNYGEFNYVVKELITFKKTDKKYVNPSDEKELVLYTCKKDILGASDVRIGVVCELSEQKFYVNAEGEAQ